MTDPIQPPTDPSVLRRLALAGASAAVVVAVLALAGCAEAESRENAAPAASPAVAVEVALARRERVADEIAATGRVEALQAIQLRPDVEGRIVQIMVREGQAVARGAPLFRIDDAELRAQHARAAAERDLARQRLRRTRELLAQNAAPAADLEVAEATARSAQALVDQLEVRLARSTVRAPFGGVAGQRLVSLGDYVSPASPLLTLQTVDPQRVAFSVPERHATELRQGQAVSFRVAALPDRSFPARVEFIDPVVQLPGRTITVKALAPNPSGLLQPGMFAAARLATRLREDAVLIPEDAVMPGLGGSNAVWIVRDGRATRREVKLGIRRAGWVEVANGVAVGDSTVVGGLMQLVEGAAVAPTVIAGDVAPAAPPPPS